MTSATRDAEPTSVTASPAAAVSADELSDAQVLRDALASAGSGGKRFRPRLVRSVHDLLGGDAGPAVDQVADAVEMLHTAFIVHDDVIDGDDLRRGAPSTPGRFHADALRVGAPAAAARSFATAGAILTGDLALGAAMRAVASAPVPRERMLQLLDLFDHTLAVSAAGELADVRLSLGCEEPTLQEALSVAEQKTAVYSFSLPMQCGAVLADSSDRLVDGLGRIGRTSAWPTSWSTTSPQSSVRRTRPAGQASPVTCARASAHRSSSTHAPPRHGLSWSAISVIPTSTSRASSTSGPPSRLPDRAPSSTTSPRSSCARRPRSPRT